MFGFPPPFDNTGVTIELREIVESGVNIWDFEYPVPRSTINYNGKTCHVDFDKASFEKKIVDHYYFRQIGQETVGRWLHYFRTRIREIMPYYVQLYEFDAKFRNIEDPLESYNLTEEFERQHSSSGSATGSTTSEDTSETTSTATREASSEIGKTGSSETSSAKSSENGLTRKFSNTPQGSISNLDNYLTEATVEDGNVSEDGSESVTTSEESNASESASETNAGKIESSNSGTSSQTSADSGEESYRLIKRGNIGVQPLGGEVENIRNAFINIDQMVINELKDLFLQVY